MIAKRLAAALAAPRLGELATGRDNNFPLLRHVAAALVVLTHAYAIAGRPLPAAWVPMLANPDLGNYSVKAFFAISGFLVAGSFVASGSLARFAIARVLRIYPALVAAVALSVALAVLANARPAPAALADAATWNYAWRNASAWSFVVGVPGAFPHNAIPAGPNGSLWSLPLEVRMYAFVALVGVAGLLARPRAGAAALVAAVAAIVALGPWDVAYVAERWQWVFVTSFLLGMAAYLARDRVPISLPIAALVAVAVVAVSGRPFAETAFTLALPYWVLVLAYHPTLPRVRLPGDYSYGIYVYAFPIQQAVAQAIPGLSAATMLAVSFPLVVAVAAMSWHGLEQPMLRRKPRPAAQRIVQSAFDPAAPEPTLDRP